MYIDSLSESISRHSPNPGLDREFRVRPFSVLRIPGSAMLGTDNARFGYSRYRKTQVCLFLVSRISGLGELGNDRTREWPNSRAIKPGIVGTENGQTPDS